MKRYMLVLIVCLASVLACGKSGTVLEPKPSGIVVVHDADSFAAAGVATTIDFENLPANGSSCPLPGEPSIDNPLVVDGVAFTDASCLRAGFCSSPTCHSANTQLFLNQGASVAPPTGTRGVLLEIEGIGETPVVFEAHDGAGKTLVVEETGRSGTLIIGFRSANGITEVRVARVGPTPDCPEAPCGPVALSSLKTVSH